MSTADRLAKWLDKGRSAFDLVRHPDCPIGKDDVLATDKASVPRDRLARTVLLEDQRGYLAVLLPSTHQLSLAEVRAQTGRELRRAHADGVREVFRDCDGRALPPAMAYGVSTWIEEALLDQPDLYVEAGDRRQLVHMRTEAFIALTATHPRGHFAHRRI